MSDTIEIVEIYRGVGIHDCQSAERIATIVRPEIDAVLEMRDPEALLDWCADLAKAPESRLLAAATLEARREMATAGRSAQQVDPDLVKSYLVGMGLGSRRCRRVRGYGSIFDPGPAPGQHGHALRPPEYRRAVEADLERLADEERAAR